MHADNAEVARGRGKPRRAEIIRVNLRSSPYICVKIYFLLLRAVRAQPPSQRRTIKGQACISTLTRVTARRDLGPLFAAQARKRERCKRGATPSSSRGRR